jgi:hypothetical protein
MAWTSIGRFVINSQQEADKSRGGCSAVDICQGALKIISSKKSIK